MFEKGGKPVAGASRSSSHRRLINDDHLKVDTYLRNIDNLWGLGHSEYVVPKPVVPELVTDRQSLFAKQANAEPSIRASIFVKNSTGT